MLKFLFLCATLLSFSVSAEDAPKGDKLGFKAWQNLSEVILSGKEKESALTTFINKFDGFYRKKAEKLLQEIITESKAKSSIEKCKNTFIEAKTKGDIEFNGKGQFVL